ASMGTHPYVPIFARKVEDRVSVTINRAPEFSFEGGALGHLNPSSDFHRDYILAQRQRGFVQFSLFRVKFQGRIQTIKRASRSLYLIAVEHAPLRLLNKRL